MIARTRALVGQNEMNDSQEAETRREYRWTIKPIIEDSKERLLKNPGNSAGIALSAGKVAESHAARLAFLGIVVPLSFLDGFKGSVSQRVVSAPRITLTNSAVDFLKNLPTTHINPTNGLPVSIGASAGDPDADAIDTSEFRNRQILAMIPPLDMRSEVDAERLKNPHLPTNSFSITSPNESKAAQPKADAPDLDNKVVKFLIQYADAGDDASQCNLALRYLQGRGVPSDKAKAIFYLKKSAVQGNANAKNLLDQLGENH